LFTSILPSVSCATNRISSWVLSTNLVDESASEVLAGAVPENVIEVTSKNKLQQALFIEHNTITTSVIIHTS
jgi:hypothetical protein